MDTREAISLLYQHGVTLSHTDPDKTDLQEALNQGMMALDALEDMIAASRAANIISSDTVQIVIADHPGLNIWEAQDEGENEERKGHPGTSNIFG